MRESMSNVNSKKTSDDIPVVEAGDGHLGELKLRITFSLLVGLPSADQSSSSLSR